MNFFHPCRAYLVGGHILSLPLLDTLAYFTEGKLHVQDHALETYKMPKQWKIETGHITDHYPKM